MARKVLIQNKFLNAFHFKGEVSKFIQMLSLKKEEERWSYSDGSMGVYSSECGWWGGRGLGTWLWGKIRIPWKNIHPWMKVEDRCNIVDSRGQLVLSCNQYVRMFITNDPPCVSLSHVLRLFQNDSIACSSEIITKCYEVCDGMISSCWFQLLSLWLET